MSGEITQDPEIRSGAPRIDGTRLTIANVVYTMTYAGVTPEDATSYHPALTKPMVLRCLEYCANQECKQNALQIYCEGCTLDEFSVENDDDEPPEDVWCWLRRS